MATKYPFIRKWDKCSQNKLINQMLLIDSFGVLARCVIMLKCLITNIDEMMLFNQSGRRMSFHTLHRNQHFEYACAHACMRLHCCKSVGCMYISSFISVWFLFLCLQPDKGSGGVVVFFYMKP